MNRLLCAALLVAAGPALAQTPPPAQAVPGTPGTVPAPLLPAAAQDDILAVRFTCADGQWLDVVFLNTAAGNSYAVVRTGDDLVPMQVAISASGARYTALSPGDDRVFWTKGDTATLYAGPEGDKVLMADCKEPD
ncbi:MliC family protein [Paracoccus endophyticus]|uniref:MliC family protein n=1 Tax=Paracoccus endophyticus TaxID=2233774 RepID=UPI000DD68E02|nr:MliC family protein [Paracoccus endophyticus]